METSRETIGTKIKHQGIQTDRDILLSILPSNVWAQTSKKLEAKHSSSLENLSNSSLYFRNVVLSKRVLFLFPEVFKIMGPQFANQKNTKIEGSNITKCRIVSKLWRQAVDPFITDSLLEPDFFNTEYPKPCDHALNTARYQYFGYMTPAKLQQFLLHFQETHLPHSSENPFIGKVVYIDVIGFTDQTQWPSIADQVSTLLRKYGHHIRILNLGLFKFNPDPNIQLQNHSWLLEWLQNCPNLTHLKVSERFNMNDNLYTAFGTRPDPESLTVFREGGHLNSSLGDRVTQFNEMWITRQRWQCDYRREDRPEHLNRRFQQELHIVRGLGANYYRQARPTTRPVVQRPVSLFPIFKDLQCLKLIQLSALNFNSLISTNTHVTWLQIETLKVEKDKYIDYLTMDFPNLIKLYLKLCSRREVRKLKCIHPSWLSLTHLHFEYCMSEICSFSHEFMEWAEIFQLISENWGNTLSDLKLRLPVAKTKKDKRLVARDLENFRWNMPNLKRLKIWLSDESGEMVANTGFFDIYRAQIEQLIIE